MRPTRRGSAFFPLALAGLLGIAAPAQTPQTQPAGMDRDSSSISGRGAGGVLRGNVYRHSVFIKGKVVVEDGRPAPADASVLIRCTGQPEWEVGLEPGGNLSIHFTAVSPETMTGPRRYGVEFGVYIDCRLHVLLNGYYSNPVIVSGYDAMGNFDAGTIRLMRKKDGEGMTVSATSVDAPPAARKALQKARAAVRKKKWKTARRRLEQAVRIHPEYAAAWYELGRVYEATGKPEKAREVYEKAVGLDESYLPPVVRLAYLDASRGDWDRVRERTGHVVDRNPYEFPEAWFYNAAACLQLKDFAGAEAAAREAVRLEAYRKYPQVLHILGMALAQQGRIEEAKAQLRRFLEIAPAARERSIVEEQLAYLEDHR